jgi:SNF2 family DNA or RNA helicase
VDEVAIELADAPMSVDMVIKKLVKLRQLTGGWIKHDDGVVHQVGKEKLHELEHLLDECQGQKVIIWCQFVHEILAIHDIYPESRVYYGAMNTKARDEARYAFEYGNCPMIIIQNDTGSMGLTLNSATVSIFYSNPTYPLPKDQARERNHRKGQTKPVTEYELLVPGSIDQTIYNAWVNKRSLADVLMGVVEGVTKADTLRKFMNPERVINWKAPKQGRD